LLCGVFGVCSTSAHFDGTAWSSHRQRSRHCLGGVFRSSTMGSVFGRICFRVSLVRGTYCKKITEPRMVLCMVMAWKRLSRSRSRLEPSLLATPVGRRWIGHLTSSNWWISKTPGHEPLAQGAAPLLHLTDLLLGFLRNTYSVAGIFTAFPPCSSGSRFAARWSVHLLHLGTVLVGSSNQWTRPFYLSHLSA